ncbi:MAG: EamA family transporter [Nanoarchaeota archaeon]|nr:EamA family transporter [Nanoarchaeota archaeon]
MGLELGIIFAFIAMLCWGFGDFLIQKSTRKFGNWETLFIITLFGALVLLPFVYKDFIDLFSSFDHTVLLLAASLIYLAAGILDLEALKRGKLAVVEPLWSLEIPVSALAAFFIISETISSYEIGLISGLIIGLVLVSLKSIKFKKHIWLERSVFIAILAAVTMGFANFFIGIGSRETNPLLAKFFFDLVFVIVASIVLFCQGKFRKLRKDVMTNKKFALIMSLLDNSAWLAFGFAMVLTPIAIAVAISESYIIIAVLLGIYVNKERLKYHQKIGIVLAIISAILLSTFLT